MAVQYCLINSCIELGIFYKSNGRAPKRFLEKLLEKWLQWPCEGHNSEPTVEALCKALISRQASHPHPASWPSLAGQTLLPKKKGHEVGQVRPVRLLGIGRGPTLDIEFEVKHYSLSRTVP